MYCAINKNWLIFLILKPYLVNVVTDNKTKTASRFPCFIYFVICFFFISIYNSILLDSYILSQFYTRTEFGDYGLPYSTFAFLSLHASFVFKNI